MKLAATFPVFGNKQTSNFPEFFLAEKLGSTESINQDDKKLAIFVLQIDKERDDLKIAHPLYSLNLGADGQNRKVTLKLLRSKTNLIKIIKSVVT